MARRHVSKTISNADLWTYIGTISRRVVGLFRHKTRPDTSAPISLAADQVDVKFRNLQIMIVPLTANELASLAGIWQTHLQKSFNNNSRAISFTQHRECIECY